MPNKHKPSAHTPQGKHGPSASSERRSISPLEKPAFENEADLDGYVDSEGHPQPHQSALEASFEDEGALGGDEARQGAATLEDLQDL
jgi:hypothetical protein